MVAKPKRSAEETRIALMEAAVQMFQSEGYEKTSTKRICAQLGISGPAVYYHFKSKNELLVAAYSRRLKAMLRAHENISRDLDVDERTWTFAALHTRLQFGAESERRYAGPYYFGVSNLIAVISPEESEQLAAIQRSYLVLLEDLIREGITTGVFLDVEPAATAFAIFGMNNLTSLWFRPGGRLSMAELSFMYADFALRIVGAEPPRRRTKLRRLVDHVLSTHNFPNLDNK